MRILVVDDSSFQRSFMVKALSSDENNVQGVDAVDQALWLIEKHEFDAVFTDIVMPGSTGFDLLEAVAKTPNPPPIVVVSADIQSSTQDRCRELGCVDFVNKPASAERLQQALQTCKGCRGGDK